MNPARESDEPEVKTYQGHTYHIRREPASHGSELRLIVDGAGVMSASELEDRGISSESVPNWTVALERYAVAYIDGFVARIDQ